MPSQSTLLILSQVPGIGANRLRTLISHFGDPARIFDASAREISTLEGLSKRLAVQITHFPGSPMYDGAKAFADRQLSRLNRAGARIVTYWDREYPEPLKRIYDPPPYLFIRGEYRGDDRYAVAIVGTRSPSDYGTIVAEKFSGEFSRLGITVVSGLARGIDTIAHSSTLRAGGRTLAVIGSGLDVVYPPENRGLFELISSAGAVISEYPMGAKPDAVNFPRRNRIISGLTLGTLVIETDVKGGAMITANFALDQNREVFAIPGNINTRRSQGCNALIKDGRAKLVENIDDILDELSAKLRPLLKASAREKEIPVDLTLFEKSVFDNLDGEGRHIDLIAGQSGLSTADALVNLLSLEFKGLVKQLPGKMFVRR